MADVAIHHDNPANPHAHIGLTLRPLDGASFGAKERSWNSREMLMEWRSEWAHACNRALVQDGHEARVDHRSHAARGLGLEPTCKVGMATAKSQDTSQDVIRERVGHNASVRASNSATILRDPTVALDALTAHEATFTRGRLGRWLERQTSGPAQREACEKAVMSCPEVRRVGRTAWGEDVYSSREMLACEWALMGLGRKMARDPGLPVPAGTVRGLAGASDLSPEQQSALRQVTEGGGRLVVVEGWAGTGKSYLFSAARQTWEGHGLRVVGGALSGRAAADLGEGAGLSESRTLASWEHAWGRGESRLGPRDVLVIDEASLVGTRQMGRVLQEAERGGAKVVLVGDTRQLQAIEAGSPMRALGQVAGRAELRDIRRQSLPWQRQASAALASGDIGAGLAAYRQDVHRHEAPGSASAAIAQAWVARERGGPGTRGGSQVALTHRRRDVASLNEAIREARREAGLLAGAEREVAVETSQGRRGMAPGDRVCFLRNDRRLGVYNGRTGTVQKAREGALDVRLDSGRPVRVPLNRYRDFDHGYALTVHKAQGVTVDHAHVWATPGLDRHAAYVAMTRHRQSLSVHAEQLDFSSRGGLEASLSRSRPKGMAMAFVAAEKECRGRQRSASERRRASEDDLLARRGGLVQACAAAHSESVRLRTLCAQQVPNASEGVARTSAYAEGERHLRDAERLLNAWGGLRREAEAQHRVRARLGLIGQVQVVSPETGRRVRLGEGMVAASRRHAQAKEALVSMARSPAALAEAEERARAARRGQARTQADLLVSEGRFRQADSSLRAMDQAHPGLAKLHALTQYGHLSEIAQLRVQGRRALLEAHCRRLTQRQEGLERRRNALGASRSASTTGPFSSEQSKNSPHLARQKSRSMYRQDRAVGCLEAQTTGLRGTLERALRELHRTRERGRDLSRDMGH